MMMLMEIAKVSISDVYYLQRNCSDAMRNDMPPAELTWRLRDEEAHPKRHDSLILGVLAVSVRLNRGRGAGRKLVYYTVHHRRLKCMKDAWAVTGLGAVRGLGGCDTVARPVARWFQNDCQMVPK